MYASLARSILCCRRAVSKWLHYHSSSGRTSKAGEVGMKCTHPLGRIANAVGRHPAPDDKSCAYVHSNEGVQRTLKHIRLAAWLSVEAPPCQEIYRREFRLNSFGEGARWRRRGSCTGVRFACERGSKYVCRSTYSTPHAPP